MEDVFTIPPGVVSVPTKKSKSANWSEANLVRWKNNRLMPIAGWEKYNYADFVSMVRAVHVWTTNAGLQMTAYLCEGACFVDDGSGVLIDISPTVPIAPPTDLIVAGGYGDDIYSYDTYGTPRPDRLDAKPITPGYYIDNWGENLLVMTGSDGRLLQWDPTPTTNNLEPVAGAPAGRGFIVTPQRHVIMIAADGIANRVAWCSQEDLADWAYASTTNSAGFYDVQPYSPIIAVSRSGKQVVLFTAAGDMFEMSYLGTPYFYSLEAINRGAVPYSPMSICDTPVGAVWMTSDGPWKHQSGAAVPVECPLVDFMYENVDEIYARYHAAMVLIGSESELWWFFPETGNAENTRYVQWNFKDGWWGMGKLARTCGFSSTYTTFPIMSDGTHVFRHESGEYYGTGDPSMMPWAKTFNINLGSGVILATMMRVLPDFGDLPEYAANLQLEFEYNIPRAGVGGLVSATSGKKDIMSDGFYGFRDTGRDFRLVFSMKTGGGGRWTVGDTIIDAIPRGRK
jgi:hypothetical protein